MRKQDLENLIAHAEASDDVSNVSSLESLIFLSRRGSERIIVEEDVHALLHFYRNRHYKFLFVEDQVLKALPNGPYMSYQGRLWEPWRIFPDTQSAFTTILEKSAAQVRGQGAQTAPYKPYLRIKVPSRLYAKKSESIRGLRVAVEDCFDISGVKTSLCNKAYYDIYPEPKDDALAVAILAANGAEVVAKTKLSSLISKEDPTEAVDFSAPFNPRGDGYQSPSGSSSGSAAAVASYDWLDAAIGTDSEYWLIRAAIESSDTRCSKRRWKNACNRERLP